MSACKDTKKGWTEKVANPVNKVAGGGKKVCHNAQKTIEEEFERPIEEELSRQERRCRELEWWNPIRWFCEIVLIVAHIVTWVIDVVVRTITVVVCHVVSAAAKVVAGLALAVVGWAVGFAVCIFTEPGEALKSFVDLWTAIVNAVGEVLDLVGTLLDDVIRLLVDIEKLIDVVFSPLGFIGSFIAGLAKWIIHFASSIVKVAATLIHSVKELLIGILTLDWCRIVSGVTGVGLGVVQVVLLIPRAFGGFIGGQRDAFQEAQVEQIVDAALQKTFANEPELLERARRKLRIGTRPFGVPVLLDVRRFFISSRSRTVDLRELHRAGVIDLNQAVGLWTDCRGHEFGNWGEWVVVYAGTETKVGWTDVQRYLDEGPDSVPEFRVYAIAEEEVERHLRLARYKAPEIGVMLNWTIGDYEVTNLDEIPLDDTEFSKKEEDEEGKKRANDVVLRRAGRKGIGDDMAHPVALAVFSYTNPERNGVTSELRLPDIVHPSGVTWRHRLPEWFYRWVLIHELGHYFGLDHSGHDGLENIMFTADELAHLETVTAASVLEYAFYSGESRFTIADARTVWEWFPANARNTLI